MPHVQAARILSAGDAAYLVRLGGRSGPKTSQRVLALVAALDAASLPGLVDIIPAYASVLVRFDPLAVDSDEMAARLARLLADIGNLPLPRGRIVHIPVCYGAGASDLDDIARRLNLSRQEVVWRHASRLYRVAFLGFMAGFPYLTGLPRALTLPRLDTPRTRVPAGSVAIAERQAGIYPVESPGGWRILGRTTTPLFDPTRVPPSLLQPGDRVRFIPLSGENQPQETPRASVAAPTRVGDAPLLRIVEPGLLATIQDHGRPGFARFGVTQAGAADPDALAIGNALLGNSLDAAALEITGGGAEFETLASGVVAVVGAPCTVHINGRAAPGGVTCALVAGDTLEISMLAAGMRVYLCAAGGIEVPVIMGSRATDVRGRFGGLEGRPLRRGDLLYYGGEAVTSNAPIAAGRVLSTELARRFPTDGQWRLRILPGPHEKRTPDLFKRLSQACFSVDARSDRVGVRLRQLDGERLEGGQILSEGLPRGAVQVPPDGEPVVLLTDAQATGGYLMPAVVISADVWRTGQLRPGDTVRFEAISSEEALAALRHRAEEIALVQRQPFPTQLLGGFAEWGAEVEMAGIRRTETKHGK
jgi:KipI family sensor histidine kinase inhibitor